MYRQSGSTWRYLPDALSPVDFAPHLVLQLQCFIHLRTPCTCSAREPQRGESALAAMPELAHLSIDCTMRSEPAQSLKSRLAAPGTWLCAQTADVPDGERVRV